MPETTKSIADEIPNEFYCIGKIGLDVKYNSKTIHKLASICLVKASLGNLSSKAISFLHKNEYTNFLKYDHALRKHSFLLGRFAAKKALVAFFKEEKEELKYNIRNGVFGEPILEGSMANVSISHTKSYGVAIVSDSFIVLGVDIESFEATSNAEYNFCTKKEIHILKSMFQWKKEEDIYYSIWSIKEALVKYLKVGFTVPFEILEISSVEYLGDVWVVLFKNFHALSVSLIKTNHLVLSICSPISVSISVNNIKEFFALIASQKKI